MLLFNFNESGNVCMDNQNAVSFSFLKKKVSIQREGQQKFHSKVFPFAISNHNNEQSNLR